MNFKKNSAAFFKRNSYLLIAAAWLITISFLIDTYWSGASSDKGVVKIIEKDVQTKQNDFAALKQDTAVLNKIVSGRYNEQNLNTIIQKKYFFFISKPDAEGIEVPIFWNTQIVYPDEVSLSSGDTTYFALLANGWYVVDKQNFELAGSEKYSLLALIPVKWDYYVQNKYLVNSFIASKNIESEYIVNTEPGKLVVKNIEGDALFFLHPAGGNTIPKNNPVALWLRVIAALLVLFFVHVWATFYAQQKGLWKGFILLILLITLLRWISYLFPVPANFRQLELFDPVIYGSNFILRSLGDLMINCLLFAWLVLFLRYHLNAKKTQFKQRSDLQKYFIIAVIAFCIIIITIVCGHIIRSLVADSQISFDVINFFSLNWYSVIGFVVLCCVAIGYFFLIQILVPLIAFFLQGRQYILYIAIALETLLLLSFRLNSPYLSFDLYLMLWCLLFMFFMNYQYLHLLASRIISSQFIFWVFFFSVSITIVIVFQNKTKELEERKHFAENLANKTDPAGERMMNIILTDFNSDFLSRIFERFTSKDDNLFLKDSLINENFSGYLNKYDTKIYTFNAEKKQLFNIDSTTWNSLNAVLETQAKPTPFPGLFYYDIAYDRFNYISKKEIKDSAKNLHGYIYILSTPKKYKTDAMYVELFSKGSVNAIESSPVYAFAIYNNKHLNTTYNDYPFRTEIEEQLVFDNGYLIKENKGYDEMWYRHSADKIIVIVKPDSFFMECITLFAYLFCSFLLITALVNILNFFVRGLISFKGIKPLWPSIRSQVHGTIILVSIFSFVVIGITTILFFVSRYHNNNREKLSRTIHIMETQIRNSLDTFSVYNDSSRLYDLAPSDQLEQMISKIAESQGTDINLYDVKGDLKISSLPQPYNYGIVSTKMDPVAFYHLNKLKDVQFFQQQNIGQLEYLSNYVPVRDEKGKEYAYLNIPYFESQNKLQEEISNFLVTIINLNAFIFLIAGIIALFITNRITRSFFLISNKMKEVNLGRMNEEITWSRHDEIGELVNEYNKMVKKLDTSAVMLARSEREGAWREMARQVAHEIKNPLTPMKLNLQYLQMAIDTNSPNVKNISVYVAKVLVEQIDHLSQIAGDFAQFANIGRTQNQVFDLNESITHISSLYSANDKLIIDFTPHQEKIMIKADKTQINRLFTNLLQNAVQSVPENRKAEIKINTKETDGKVIVSIKDNGNGIPEEMKKKIFIPNFTTKSSGTGLGLAMCKGIVEKLGGQIWFETKENDYTIFYVELDIEN